MVISILESQKIGNYKILFAKGETKEIIGLRALISTGGPKKISMSRLEDLIDYANKNPEEINRRFELFMEVHHPDMIETGNYFMLIEVPISISFLMWLGIRPGFGIYGVGTEFSLRYSKPPELKSDLGYEDKYAPYFEAYKYAIEKGIPKEAARFILPLGTETWVILQFPPFRDYFKFANYLKEVSKLIENENLVEMGEIIEKFVEENLGIKPVKKEKPLTLSFNEKKLMEKFGYNELYGTKLDLNYSSNTYISVNNTLDTILITSELPIAIIRQIIRHRQIMPYLLPPKTWPQFLEYKGIYYGAYIKNREDIRNIFERVVEYSKHAIEKEEKIIEKLNHIPLGTYIPIAMLIPQQAIEYIIEQRTCHRAQLETRIFFEAVAKYLQKIYGKVMGPSCITKGECYELGKESCPVYISLSKLGKIR